MSNQNIEPPKITKPIQLLAAWLAGLILINGSFLATATSLSTPTWAPAALVVASILNVPLFLACLFLLQTKFRPEMQEDAYYAKYLELNTGKIVITSPADTLIRQLQIEISEYQHRNTELLSSFELSLKLISQKIGGHSVSELPSRSEFLAIADEIDKSAKISETKSEQISVQLNDMLSEHVAIRRELRKHQIIVERTFGSTSETPEVPKYKIIGFGKNVPIDQLRNIVQVCRNFGFDRIHFSGEDYSEGRVYIGSYIYRAPDEPQPVPISENILRLLGSADIELADVIDEIESNRG